MEEVEEVAAAAPVEAAPEETAAADTAGPDAAIVAAQAKLQAEEKLEQPAPVQVAKVEKPKKVDDRKLKKAAAEYEKALQVYEKLQFRALGADSRSPRLANQSLNPFIRCHERTERSETQELRNSGT